MDMLKKFWPDAFSVQKGNIASLVVKLIVWIVAAAIAGVLLGIIGLVVVWIPLLGWLVATVLGIVGGLIELYSIIGIVLTILVFCDVLKD